PSTATLRYFNSVSGIFCFDASVAPGCTDTPTYYGNGTKWPNDAGTIAKITVVDADLNGNPNVAETIFNSTFVRTSADLNAEVNVTLRETGINTGIFEGKINFTTDTPSINGTDSGQLYSTILVSGGYGPQGAIPTILTARYLDASDALGNAATVTHTAAWQE